MNVSVWPAIEVAPLTMDDGITIVTEDGSVLAYTSEVKQKLHSGLLLTFDPRPSPQTEIDSPTSQIEQGAALTVVDLFGRAGNYNGQPAIANNYDTGNDLGGGVFYWNAASTTAHNGGTVVGTYAVGRWFRRYSGSLDVTWFGAKGDGVTDDRAAILAAMTAAAGVPVYFPPGTYLVPPLTGAASSLDVPSSDTTLIGVSGKSWLKHPTGMPNASRAIIRMDGLSNVVIRGLGFDGNWGAVSGVTDRLDTWQASHAYVVGNKVQHLDGSTNRMYRCISITTGISGSTGPLGTSTGSIVDGGVTWTYIGDGTLDPVNHIGQVDPKNRQIMVHGCTNVLITECVFKQAYGDYVWIGAKTTDGTIGSVGVTISHCTGDLSARNGVTFGQKCEWIRIIDCRFTTIYAQCIDTEPVGDFKTVRDVDIEQCLLGGWWNAANPIRYESNSPLSIVGAAASGGASNPSPGESCLARNFRVRDCTIEGSVNIYRAADVVLEGNRIICDFSGYSWAPVIVDHFVNDLRIIDNYIYDRTAPGGVDGRHEAAITIRNYDSTARPASIAVRGNRIHVRNGRHGIAVIGTGGTVGDTGTATGVTSTSLTDGGKVWTANAFKEHIVVMGGVQAAIVSNTATMLTLVSWQTPLGVAASTPAAGAYTILPNGGVVEVSDNFVECIDDGNGAGGFGIYLDAGDLGFAGRSRMRVARNTIRNANVDAINIKSRASNPFLHLEIADNHAFDDQATPTCTSTVRFQTTPAISYTKLVMRGNVAGDGVAAALTGPTTQKWLLSGGAVEQWAGYGAPSTAAPIGSTYSRLDGGAGTSLYVYNGGSGGWIAAEETLSGSATYNPSNLPDGDWETTTVTVTGAALGDYAVASFSNDVGGVECTAWVSAADTVTVRFRNVLENVLTGSATVNPANLADGAGENFTITVTGAALGDFVQISSSVDLQGYTLTGYVSAADTVIVRSQNETGAGLDLGASVVIRARVYPQGSAAINLSSGTLRARVRKA